VIIYGVDAILPVMSDADRLAASVSTEELDDALAPMRWFLEQVSIGAGIKLAPSGRLGRKLRTRMTYRRWFNCRCCSSACGWSVP